MQLTRGARPIKLQPILDHYQAHKYNDVTLAEYADAWRTWLTTSSLKYLAGLERFPYADYTAGTSQTFDHFVLKYTSTREIAVLPGDFQYHACMSRHNKFTYLTEPTVSAGQALIISFPFSDLGSEHPEMRNLFEQCNQLGVPVCLDLAYWGVAKQVRLDLDKYPCIKEITASLSKPFYTLENHRIGIRFTRDYCDDGISMTNEVNMQNTYSMSLGVDFMKTFDADWIWNQYQTRYFAVCEELNLISTDTIIFALGDQHRHKEFNRGVANKYRVCVSTYLENLNG
jgi:hypothetical protein